MSSADRFRPSEWRARLEKILVTAITAVDPERLVFDALIGDRSLGTGGKTVVLAVGKAAAGMAKGAMAAFGNEATGVVVGPTPSTVAGLSAVAGNHPIPGDASFAAGRLLYEAASAAGGEDLVLILLSGGASALAEVPAAGISAAEVVAMSTALLDSGLPITEINKRRAALSLIKGGGLASAARPARVVTLAISDVPAISPEAIGSGPAIGSDDFRVLADGATAARAAATACRRVGLITVMLDDEISGMAAQVGTALGSRAVALESASAFVGYGETTVRIDTPGDGGRNQELALSAALVIEGCDVTLAAMGTDGIDGPTKNAGGMVDGTTISRGNRIGLDALKCLATHDSARYLEAVGDVIVTGPTGTNVGDLVVAVHP